MAAGRETGNHHGHARKICAREMGRVAAERGIRGQGRGEDASRRGSREARELTGVRENENVLVYGAESTTEYSGSLEPSPARRGATSSALTDPHNRAQLIIVGGA